MLKKKQKNPKKTQEKNQEKKWLKQVFLWQPVTNKNATSTISLGFAIATQTGYADV